MGKPPVAPLLDLLHAPLSDRYTDVVDFGVRLTMRFLINPRGRRGTTQAMWEEILRAFAAAPDIDLAYPTQRFYTLGEGGSGPAPAARPQQLPGPP